VQDVIGSALNTDTSCISPTYAFCAHAVTRGICGYRTLTLK